MHWLTRMPDPRGKCLKATFVKALMTALAASRIAQLSVCVCSTAFSNIRWRHCTFFYAHINKERVVDSVVGASLLFAGKKRANFGRSYAALHQLDVVVALY